MAVETEITQLISPAPALEPIGRSRSVADEVYRSIRAAIVHHRLRPGERVTEARLAEAFKVSKTPVREALLRLHEVGLVTLSPNGQGVSIAHETAAAVRNAFEVRAILERGTAEFAAMRRSAMDIQAIAAAAEASVACAIEGDVTGFATEDAKFHLAIAYAAKNDRLVKLLFDSLDLVAALRNRAEPVTEASVDCATAHRWVLEAIVDQQPTEAGKRMEQHVRKAVGVTAVGPEVLDVRMKLSDG